MYKIVYLRMFGILVMNTNPIAINVRSINDYWRMYLYIIGKTKIILFSRFYFSCLVRKRFLIKGNQDLARTYVGKL